MLGNMVQWQKKPISHMRTFIRISSEDINDWSNAIRGQKRLIWSRYWYWLHMHWGSARDERVATRQGLICLPKDSGFYVLRAGFIIWMCINVVHVTCWYWESHEQADWFFCFALINYKDFTFSVCERVIFSCKRELIDVTSNCNDIFIIKMCCIHE